MSDETEQIQDAAPEPEPAVETITFEPAIVVGASSPAQPLVTVESVEYRGNDGNHVIRLSDGRVVAVPALSDDKSADIRAGLA